MNNVHFSSETDMWATPKEFFDALNREFGFDLDVCALPSNAKCKRFFSPQENGLAQEWYGTCWMNPPYGKEIGDWIRKAYESACVGCVCVCLVPCRTDTAWWHDFVMRAAEVRLIRGRLRFGDSETGAPFPSAVVVFRHGYHAPVFFAMDARQNAPFSILDDTDDADAIARELDIL